jgi:hypothetical protein
MTPVKSKISSLFLLLSLAPSIASTSFVFLTAPDFRELFKNLSSELPLTVRLFTDFYFLTLITPIGIFLLWEYWPFEKYRSIICPIIGFILGLIMFVTYIRAMYVPIFQYSST